jgi:dolichyl-phosphate-mannose-protein mannosyltransferase
MSNKWLIIIILGLGILTRFIFFGHPNQAVFDEVHFGKFISAYYTHQYYFDIHPPLGKLIIAGFAKIFNFSPEYKFAVIGEKFQSKEYMALRFLPSLAGAILPLIIFLLIVQIGFSRRMAMLSALLIVFENGLIAQSRFILMDAFLLLFGFSSLLFYFRYRNDHGWLNLFFAGTFGALALSIKWTGLTFLALIILLELTSLIRQYKGALCTKGTFVLTAEKLLFLILVPIIIYFSIFAIHFSLLNHSGEGDAFMSPAFQRTLISSEYSEDLNQEPANIFQKFTEINAQMFISNKNLTAAHSYSSKWYTWPFMIRPIYYWVDGNSRIYFIGNPLIWWLSTVAVIILLLRNFQFLISNFQKKLKINKKELFILGGFLINLLPFIFIGRVMFLYHYLIAYIFSIAALAYVFDKQLNRKAILSILILLMALFLVFSPLTYGLPLNKYFYENLIWLQTWR